jgi:acetoacetyl-CoA synthetase
MIFLDTYKDLYEWSVKNNIDFWREFWHFSKINHSKSYDQVNLKILLDDDQKVFKVNLFKVLDTSKKFDEIPEWFKGSLLNYAQNLLDSLDLDEDKIAVYSTGLLFLE